jgi:hypothetical protein
MQIVIDIDEEDFNIMKHNVAIDNPLCPLGEKEMVTAVANGTPIPKGHGRLIDKDALGEKLHRYTEAPYQYALTVFNESPIIINADRSEDK